MTKIQHRLTTPAADLLFQTAKKRVYRVIPPIGMPQQFEEHKTDGVSPKLVATLEIPPKWTLLKDVLIEIDADFSKNSQSDSRRVLLVVKDERTIIQLSEVIERGELNTISRLHRRFVLGNQLSAIRAKLMTSNSNNLNVSGSGGGGSGVATSSRMLINKPTVINANQGKSSRSEVLKYINMKQFDSLPVESQLILLHVSFYQIFS